ncbi:IS30 family transposase, partial [Proteiniclasticum sp. SCR006]
TKDQIALLDELLTPLIKKSQSVNHIYGTHRKTLRISKSTFYTYCNLSLFTFRNIDLPRKVRYKQRKKRPKDRIDQSYRVGRTYDDFTAYMEANADTSVVEMDVVETVKGGRVFLTFYFRQTKLMLAFLMESQTQHCVTEVIDYLENLLGLSVFMKIFPLILTDNGSEFKHAETMEYSITGAKRCSVYYCDPMASHQKGGIEKNHEFIREYIPKYTSIGFMNQGLTLLMINHINSIIRESINEKTPYDLAELLMPPTALELLGLRRIKPDSVIRNPTIFNH